MTRKTLIYLLCAALFCAFACHRIEQPPKGMVTLSFNVGDPATRAESLGDGNAADGGGIYCAYEGGVVKPDLYIFIADETGQVIKYYDGLGVDLNDDGELSYNNYDSEKHSSTSLMISFTFAQAGNYTVYALANTRATGSNLVIPSLPNPALMTSLTLSDLDGMILSLSTEALTANAAVTPTVGDRMPLSAKGSLNVYKNESSNSYNGQVGLEMLRCFGKVQFYFKNLTGAALNLYLPEVKIYDMNAKEGYLFAHAPDDFVIPASGSNYRNYSWTAPNSSTAYSIADGGTLSLLPTPPLFFPSIAPLKDKPSAGNRYLCDIIFRVPKPGVTYNANNSSTYNKKEFKNLPIHDNMSQDILALGRNQYLKIETTISATAVSFNFIVKDWTDKPEEVFFH